MCGKCSEEIPMPCSSNRTSTEPLTRVRPTLMRVFGGEYLTAFSRKTRKRSQRKDSSPVEADRKSTQLNSNHAQNPKFDSFFFNDNATTEIYTLSLHDALPICSRR